MSNLIEDSELYVRLAEPKFNITEATKIGNEFYEELCKLREKYNVPEIVVAFGMNIKEDEQTEGVKLNNRFLIQVGFRGGFKTDRLIFELLGNTNVGKSLLNLIKDVAIATNEQ